MGVRKMAKAAEQANKALVLEAFDTLFNKRDYKAAERYWSSNHIQHSAQLPDSFTYRKAGVCAEGG
jgi:predicted SnoaL-like aldol condensation-catalyzing enzyme